MTAHTPGPWTAVQDGNEVDWYLVDDDESVIVFGLSEPDARLIAAAPDLLAVANRIALWPARKRPAMLALQEAARTAIAKAEGTSC